MNNDYIDGNEAIQRMREISRGHNTHFMLLHLTYDRKTGSGGVFRKVERARLRTAMSDEAFSLPGEHYLPYTDLDTDEPKMCWRKLIRYVGFPPDYKLLKVDWFKRFVK